MRHSLIMIPILLFGLFALMQFSSGCNEAVCASVVSKCMLTQSCKCDLKDCSCCKECFSCLSYLYSECCSCVDMCPKPNETYHNELSKASYVEELPDGVPGLFTALTSEPDIQKRWLTFIFPVDFDVALYHTNKAEKDIKYHLQTVEEDLQPIKPNIITVNCTVAYMSQCMSSNKCKASCQSMGSSSFRWFHDGCCECIGATCINYGINESRCLSCSEGNSENGKGIDDDDDLLSYDEDFDYGEDMETHNTNTNMNR